MESLLERARCYALLGQQKTAIFDFSAILKDHPEHVQALCGRSFTHLLLNQQQVRGPRKESRWRLRPFDFLYYCRSTDCRK